MSLSLQELADLSLQKDRPVSQKLQTLFSNLCIENDIFQWNPSTWIKSKESLKKMINSVSAIYKLFLTLQQSVWYFYGKSYNVRKVLNLNFVK